jgi:hypothetical protein
VNTVVAKAPPQASPGPRLTLWLLRALTLLFLPAVLAQPVLAGLYLSGEWDALGVHSANATLVQSLSLLLLLSALAYWLVGGGRGRVPAVAAALFVAVVLQAGFGYGREFGLHIPLGVAVVTTSVLFAFWVFRQGARIPRRTWRRPR